MTWEVFVSSIGRVYGSENEAKARAQFASYVTLSSAPKREAGRYARKNVALFKDGEIVATTTYSWRSKSY